MPPKNKKALLASKGKTTVDQPSVKWPPLKPLVPLIDLHVETLLVDQILLIRNLFTPTLCRNYVSFLSSLPLSTTSIQPRKDEALRVNDRFVIDDPAFAEMLWSQTALRDLVAGPLDGNQAGDELSHRNLEKVFGGKVLGLNPRIRIYRYGSLTYFAQHKDSRS